jgi:hypothetical protein
MPNNENSQRFEFFKTSRIRFSELYQDSINFVKATYEDVGQYFTMASPMGQLLQITLHLGRMILYYNEDSITELNINTASRPASVKGVASLTGHNPSRAMAARGTLRFTYNGEKLDLYGNTVTIPNYTQITSTTNGLTYTVVLPGEEVRLDLTSINNYVDVNVMQGKLEYQQATGTGDPLQSYNFQNKKGAGIDNFFVNVYVDGERWQKVNSIFDMVFNEKACMVKTGATGGIDVFFGNGYNGMPPRIGSTILVEYLLTDGEPGNIRTPSAQQLTNWKFETRGYALNGEEVDLNKIIKTSVTNDILFGTLEEPLYLTRLLAPKTSRSFVLANTDNYIYFLRKLNQFTIVDAIPGFATFEDRFALDKYNQAKTTYENVQEQYRRLVSSVGANSTQAQNKKTELDNAQRELYRRQEILDEQKKDDNTVYLFLIPDVNKRISSAENYYTCSLDSFRLTSDEKTAILDLIEDSGQRIITVDNAIMTLKYPRFVLNMSLIIFEGFEFDVIREQIISKTSDYFLKNTRRDRIPQSDIVKVIENIDGVDSVTVWFDAAADNQNIYQQGYGLDDYGDILLERYVNDAFGNKVPVKDIYPLIRGGFESSNGVEYEDSLEKDKLSTVNINLRGTTPDDVNTKNNKTIVSNL